MLHSVNMSDFYRATLCVSAVFAVAGCLSVRPSVRLSRCWIQTAEDDIENVTLTGSHRRSIEW